VPSVVGRRASGKVLPPGRRRTATALPGGSRSSADLLGLYLEEIGREPLLSEREEKDLARAIERGREASEHLRLHAGTLAPDARATLERAVDEGERARERFIRANLRLVVSVARRWTRSPLPLLDLIQEGNVGLIRAVERFDHRRGFRFSTFATWLIRQAISRAVANTGRLVRLPVRTGEALARVVQEQHRLEEGPSARPSVEAIAAGTGLSVEQVDVLLRVAPEPVSLSEPVGDGGVELADLVTDATPYPDELAVACLTAEEVDGLLPSLEDDDRAVLVLRFGLGGAAPMTLASVARTLGVSPDAVRQRQTRGLRTLRRAMDPARISRYSQVACS
jgi:RNA polymerase sigma factor (sigma-70 family)